MSPTLVKPPLQLELHFYPAIKIEADKNFKPGTPAQAKLNLHQVKSMINNDAFHWEVEQTIVMEPEGKAPIPYRVFLKVIGHFGVAESMNKEKIPELIEVTGGSMLFSAAREFILMVTARGPWPPVALPTVRIVPEQAKAPEGLAVKEPKPKKYQANKIKKEH